MSHKERNERRRTMAEAVVADDPASIARVATANGVTVETVRAACRQHAPEKLQSSRPKSSAA